MYWCTRTRTLRFRTFDKRTIEKFNATRILRFPDQRTLLWDDCLDSIVTSQCDRFVATCSDLENFIVPVANILHELYSKGYPYRRMWSKVISFLRSNLPLYHHEHSSRTPESLLFITTQAIAHRVAHLWWVGLEEYDRRNHRLGFVEPTESMRPLQPAPHLSHGPAMYIRTTDLWYPHYEDPSFWIGKT